MRKYWVFTTEYFALFYIDINIKCNRNPSNRVVLSIKTSLLTFKISNTVFSPYFPFYWKYKNNTNIGSFSNLRQLVGAKINNFFFEYVTEYPNNFCSQRLIFLRAVLFSNPHFDLLEKSTVLPDTHQIFNYNQLYPSECKIKISYFVLLGHLLISTSVFR